MLRTHIDCLSGETSLKLASRVTSESAMLTYEQVTAP